MGRLSCGSSPRRRLPAWQAGLSGRTPMSPYTRYRKDNRHYARSPPMMRAMSFATLGFSAINAIIILYFLMVDITFSFLWTSWACQLSGSCPALSPASLSAWRWACPDPVSTALCPAWWLLLVLPPELTATCVRLSAVGVTSFGCTLSGICPVRRAVHDR